MVIEEIILFLLVLFGTGLLVFYFARASFRADEKVKEKDKEEKKKHAVEMYEKQEENITKTIKEDSNGVDNI